MLIKNICVRSIHYHSILNPNSNIHACVALLKTRNYNTSSIEDKRKQYRINHQNTSKSNNHILQKLDTQNFVPVRNFLRYKSTEPSTVPKETTEKANNKKIVVALSASEKLKKAVKEYGSTVIVFHVGISLISLGTCYLLVTSGLDVTKVFTAIGLDKWATESQLASSAGTFAVAYAIHKVFAPVRIAITLTSVPLIVRYLRKIGFLKK